MINDDIKLLREACSGTIGEKTGAISRLCNEVERLQGLDGSILETTKQSETHSFMFEAVDQEVDKAIANWPPFNSAHEGYGILAEEFIELQQHVFTNQKRRDLAAMRKEAIQVAAMAIRFAAECCDESTGRK